MNINLDKITLPSTVDLWIRESLTNKNPQAAKNLLVLFIRQNELPKEVKTKVLEFYIQRFTEIYDGKSADVALGLTNSKGNKISEYKIRNENRDMNICIEFLLRRKAGGNSEAIKDALAQGYAIEKRMVEKILTKNDLPNFLSDILDGD